MTPHDRRLQLGQRDWYADPSPDLIARTADIMDTLRVAREQAQAEAWKLSKSDVAFLTQIKIKP